MAHNYAEVFAAGESLEDVVGKALCGHAYHIFVHTVGAGAHNTAETTCAKLEILIEGLNEVGLVSIIKHRLDGGFGFIIETGTQPGLCLGGAFLEKLFVHCF